MTVGQLLKTLSIYAKDYSEVAGESIKRNGHMNNFPADREVDKLLVDAAIVDFINYIGMRNCVDYAMYTSDLEKTPEEI